MPRVGGAFCGWCWVMVACGDVGEGSMYLITVLPYIHNTVNNTVEYLLILSEQSKTNIYFHNRYWY